MKTNNRGLRILFTLLIGGVPVLGELFLPASLVAPALLAFLGAAWGGAYFLLALAVAAAGSFAVAGFEAAALYRLLLAALPAVAIYAGLRMHRPHRSGVMAASIFSALGLYALLCVPSLLDGAGPFDGVTSAFESFSGQLKQQVGALLAGDAEAAAYMADYLNAYLAEFKALLPEITMGLVVTLGMGMGLGNYLLARALCLGQGTDVREMAPFCRWQLTRSFMGGLCILVLGAMVMRLIGLNNAGALTMAVECIALFPLALLGICTAEFFISQRPGGAARRLLLYLAIVLLLPVSLFAMALVGLVERLFRLRSRAGRPPAG